MRPGSQPSAVQAKTLAGAAILAAVGLWTASPAGAQLLPIGGDSSPPLAPGHSPPKGKSKPIHSPKGQAIAYNGNPSRTGEVREPRLFGPLRLAWAKEMQPSVTAPIVAGGRVLVTAPLGTAKPPQLRAFNARNGRAVWRQTIRTQFYSAPIAAGAGLAVVQSHDGAVTAFALKNGSQRWKRTLTTSEALRTRSAPVIAGGTVYVWGGTAIIGHGTLFALRARDGRELWRAAVAIDSGTAEAAVDNRRVLVADHCGGAAAVSRSDGRVVWQHRVAAGSSSCWAATAIVSGGRLFSGGGRVYDAVTGSTRKRLRQGHPDAVARGTAFYKSPPAAVRLKGGKRLWRGKGRSLLSPIVVGGTLYVALQKSVVGLDVATGRRLSGFKTGDPGINTQGANRSGLGAGAGMLFVGRGRSLRAYRPVLRPHRRGTDTIPRLADVRAGKRVSVVAGLGSRIRKRGRPLVLEAASAGQGRFGRVGSKRAQSDGTAYFKVKVGRNTRVRARTRGARSTRSSVVYAYPKVKLRFKRVSSTRGVARMTFSRVPGGVLAGRRAFVYHGQAGRKRLVRMGGATLRRTGGRSATANAPFRLLKKLGKRDFFYHCVSGLAKRGWGRSHRFSRGCGTRVMSYGRAKPRVRLSSPSAGEGTPPPSVERRPAVGQPVVR